MLKKQEPTYECEVGEFSRLLYTCNSVSIGGFYAPIGHQRFSQESAMKRPSMVFPRTAVHICQAGEKPFLSDINGVNFYNPHQEYTRIAVQKNDDICDWFEFSHNVIVAALAEYYPDIDGQSAQLFDFSSLPASPLIYLKQRQLINWLADNTVESLTVEEIALQLLEQTLEFGLRKNRPKRKLRSKKNLLHHDICESLRNLLAQNFNSNQTITELASELNVSGYHLCRIFRNITGKSIHQYRTELRLNHSLNLLPCFGNLTDIALELGFSSHSHFTTIFKQNFGLSPKQYLLRLHKNLFVNWNITDVWTSNTE